MPESNPPPSLPEVYDEAGNSPRWLPALGIGLLVILVAVVTSSAMTHRPPPPAAHHAEDAVQVSAAPMPAHV
jgi:hypothetical protein